MADIRDRRLFDYDEFSGTTEYFHYDPETKGFVIEAEQDLSTLIEVNKALHNDAPLRFGEFNHVAHIPRVIMEGLIKDGIMSPGGAAILDEKRFKRWINDRSNRAFRTRPGVI